MYSQKSVVRNNNIITINSLNSQKCVQDFLYKIYEGCNKGYKDFRIFSHVDGIYPNACVPIAGIIEYYKKTQDIEFEFSCDEEDYLHKCGFDVSGNDYSKEFAQSPFDRIFRYNTSQQVADLTQAYIDFLSRTDECEEGVLDGLTWCINEILDNVLIHSGENYGFIMAQYHPQNKHIAVCVYDYGMGIYNSLKDSKHKPRTPLDAISYAIQEGVGDGKGQGNGLYGLYKIVCENKGSLTITSGPASLRLDNTGELNKSENLLFLSTANNATIVDFQLDLSMKIDIRSAFKNIGGYDCLDMRIDNMLDEKDAVHYNVFENCQGTATRKAGEFLKNDVKNIWRRNNSVVILDFCDVKTVSSSFIDEFIAKLITEIGIIKFNQIFRVINMNDTIEYLCNRSIQMRIHDKWKGEISK